MKTTAVAVLIALASGQVQAACYADYKAKQDNPLRLHYGVVELQSDCSRPAAEAEVQARLSAAGWTLLNIMAVFDETGLSERKDSAGQYFLRF